MSKFRIHLVSGREVDFETPDHENVLDFTEALIAKNPRFLNIGDKLSFAVDNIETITKVED